MNSDEPTGEFPVPSGEGDFSMDPEAVMWELSRMLVRGQRDLASIRSTVERVRQAGDHASRAAGEYLAEAAAFEKDWYAQTLPMIAASMQLALEVYDTFGPGVTQVTDPTEAAIWNNKHHVWFRELSTGS